MKNNGNEKDKVRNGEFKIFKEKYRENEGIKRINFNNKKEDFKEWKCFVKEGE